MSLRCAETPPDISDNGCLTVPSRQQITGLILAGGRGIRMGGADKGLVLLGNRPMVEHVIIRLHPQVGELLINANRNHARYAEFGYRIVSDTHEESLGPLAGMVSGLQVAKTDYIVTTPCDSPLLSDTLVARLTIAMKNEDADLA